MQIHEYFEWSAIGFGAISAVLWAWTSCKRVPRLTVPYGGKFRDDHPWIVATDKVAMATKLASLVTAFAVTFQTLAAVMEKMVS